MLNNGYDQTLAKSVVAASKADLIAFGSVFISNPDLVEHFAHKAPLHELDTTTIYGGSTQGHTDCPSLTH